jgi:hypothetical protein
MSLQDIYEIRFTFKQKVILGHMSRHRHVDTYFQFFWTNFLGIVKNGRW